MRPVEHLRGRDKAVRLPVELKQEDLHRAGPLGGMHDTQPVDAEPSPPGPERVTGSKGSALALPERVPEAFLLTV